MDGILTFLIIKKKNWKIGNNILVLTGGGDIDGLGKSWPKLFEKILPMEQK